MKRIAFKDKINFTEETVSVAQMILINKVIDKKIQLKN